MVEGLIYMAIAFGIFTAYCKNKKFRNMVDSMEDE